jgi:hypothetical protein
MMNQPATLQSLSPLIVEPFDVHVLDVSKGGMCVQLERHVAAQSEVKVRLRGLLIFGQVKYCVPARGGFRAGIKIKETIPPTGAIKTAE